MLKIIFLDIDGVLNVRRTDRDKYGSLFHDNFVDNLRMIVEKTGAYIVISSTWRFSGWNNIQDMWRDRDLPGKVVGLTPDYAKIDLWDDTMGRVERGFEIQEWLKHHPRVSNYVILDDDDDMLTSQRSHFVKTSDNINHPDCIDIGYGLTKQCALDAIRILNNNIKQKDE